jgi:DNA mismatch repair protein MSH5
MDNHFGDLYGMISDREIEISHELAQFVLKYEVLLTTVSDICGEVDRSVKPEVLWPRHQD